MKFGKPFARCVEITDTKGQPFGQFAWWSLILIIILALNVGGCRSPQDVVLVSDPADTDTDQQEKTKTNTWDTMAPNSPDDPSIQPHFIKAENAPNAPKLKVENLTGEKKEIDPARRGHVTIVLFWSIDSTANRVACAHIQNLVRKYRRAGAAGLTISEKTKNYRKTPGFFRRYDIALATYYDDFSALKKMGRAVGESVKKEVPFFFIIDRKGRIRLHKRGFNYMGLISEWSGTVRQEVTENAPPNQRIEDYLKRLLRNR